MRRWETAFNLCPDFLGRLGQTLSISGKWAVQQPCLANKTNVVMMQWKYRPWCSGNEAEYRAPDRAKCKAKFCGRRRLMVQAFSTVKHNITQIPGSKTKSALKTTADKLATYKNFCQDHIPIRLRACQKWLQISHHSINVQQIVEQTTSDWFTVLRSDFPVFFRSSMTTFCHESHLPFLLWIVCGGHAIF